MRTAIDVLRDATGKVSTTFGKDILFHHGETESVVNYITKLQKANKKAYPAVIMFTEGKFEIMRRYYLEFTIPKVAICTLTKLNATDDQRLESNFQEIIYPIFESLTAELKKLHYGYDFEPPRLDCLYNNKMDKFNQLVDGCFFKITNMKVIYQHCKR